jgi:TBC1 domain family member 6
MRNQPPQLLRTESSLRHESSNLGWDDQPKPVFNLNSFSPRPDSPMTMTSTRAEERPSTQQTEVKASDSTKAPRSSDPSSAPRDRYGFKKSSQHISLEDYNDWSYTYTPYLARRRKKWDALMKSHSCLPAAGSKDPIPTKFPSRSDKVKRYVRKGIPPEWRGNAWFFYAGGPQMIAREPSLYKHLCHKANMGRGFLSDTDRESIERDLHRTFPENVLFKPDTYDAMADPEGKDRPETPMIAALRRVLQAFAIHNPNIGYCQSLNFLAGMLLLFLDGSEEKAFVLLNVLTNTHFPGVHAKVLESDIEVGTLLLCIQEYLPGVWTKITEDDPAVPASTEVANESRPTSSAGSKKKKRNKPELGNQLPTVSLVLTNWLMPLFISALPIETVARIWDVLFYEGSKAIFRMALAIFKAGELEIHNIKESLEALQVVQTIPKKLLDVNALVEICYKRRGGFGSLSQDTIDRRRRERREIWRKERNAKDGGRRRGKTETVDPNKQLLTGGSAPETPMLTGSLPGTPMMTGSLPGTPMMHASRPEQAMDAPRQYMVNPMRENVPDMPPLDTIYQHQERYNPGNPTSGYAHREPDAAQMQINPPTLEQPMERQASNSYRAQPDRQVSAGHQAPLDRQVSVSYQKQPDRQVSAGHQAPLDRQVSVSHQTQPDRQVSAGHQVPLDRQVSVSHQAQPDRYGREPRMSNHRYQDEPATRQVRISNQYRMGANGGNDRMSSNQFSLIHPKTRPSVTAAPYEKPQVRQPSGRISTAPTSHPQSFMSASRSNTFDLAASTPLAPTIPSEDEEEEEGESEEDGVSHRGREQSRESHTGLGISRAKSRGMKMGQLIHGT